MEETVGTVKVRFSSEAGHCPAASERRFPRLTGPSDFSYHQGMEGDRLNRACSPEAMFCEFLEIARLLNEEFDETPVLYGSLGLSRLVSSPLDPEDIDVLVRDVVLDKSWHRLRAGMIRLGFNLVHEAEHEFRRKGLSVAFAPNDLDQFVGLDQSSLLTASESGASYHYLGLAQYRLVYAMSAKDGYRAEKRGKADRKKQIGRAHV